jgi:hypothetical protein
MVVDLISLLKKIFELNGFEVLDREPKEIIWLRNEEGVEIIQVVEDKEVDGELVLNFSRMTEQVKVDKTIVCLKGCTQDARKMGDKLGISLIDRKAFSFILGELILDIHEKGMLEELHIFEEEDVEVEDIEPEEEDVIPIFLEEVGTEGEEKVIKPTISAEEASALARNYLHGRDSEMLLLPNYVFEFSLEVIFEGSIDTKQMSGVLAVNALSGSYSIWKRGYETTNSISMEHRKMEPKIGMEDARERAEEAINEEFSREEEVKIEHENVTIIEKRKTRPKNQNYLQMR